MYISCGAEIQKRRHVIILGLEKKLESKE